MAAHDSEAVKSWAFVGMFHLAAVAAQRTPIGTASGFISTGRRADPVSLLRVIFGVLRIGEISLHAPVWHQPDQRHRRERDETELGLDEGQSDSRDIDNR
ncbi:MAG: hypothetical protein ABI137_14770 [Antricoccus sp.]